MTALQDRLLTAHNAQDVRLLVGLYREAAADAATEDQRAFFLTHALVYALEAGSTDAAEIRALLVAMNRDTPH